MTTLIRGLKGMLLCVMVVFAVPACVASDDPGVDVQSSVDEALQGTIAPNAFTCNGFAPGLPVPISREPQFEFCIENCDPHGIPGACTSFCCKEATRRTGFAGCTQCFIQ